MQFRKSLVDIGNIPCSVVQFNYNSPKDKNISEPRMHFIQILDRSGSMAPHIDELVENIKKTVDMMGETDLLSVIWFSGPGQCKVLLKGSSPADPALKKQLDKLKSTYSTTCFSEAMTEARNIVEDLAELCSNFVITLFTDGEPVVPWSVNEEESRTISILKEFCDKIISFNTIGFGGYYNSNFLKELASLSKFGRHAHSTSINEYLPIFTHNFKAVENISINKIKLHCPGGSILYMTKRNSRLDSNFLDTNLSSKAENKFYLIYPSKDDFTFKIDDKTYSTSKIKSRLTVKHIEDLLNTLAYEEYYKGNSSMALDILEKSLKDKYLATSILNAFTAKERQKCTDTLLAAAHNKKITIAPRLWGTARLLNGVLSENEVPESGTCFMELLEIFEKNGDRYIPASPDRYKRIGRKVVDNYNAFTIDKAHKLTVDFGSLVFTKEKLNISIRYEIPGIVTINPKQARNAGLKSNRLPAKIFREQTIIKDGDMNMDELQALVSKNTLNYLQSLGRPDLITIMENNSCPFPGLTLIKLNMAKLPVISRSYVSKSDSLDYVLETCYEQRAAECKQKVLKYYLDKMYKDPKPLRSIYTKSQLELLDCFGLDASGIYHGIDNQVVSADVEQYQCRYFEFAIKGFSKLPKVEDLLKKMKDGKRKLNGPEDIMAHAIKYILNKKYENNEMELTRLLEMQKYIIKLSTRNLALIKLTKTLTAGWWQGLKLDNRDNYLYEKESKTLVIKVVKKTVSI